MEEPQRHRDHRDRALRQCALRKGGLGIGAGQREVSKNTPNVVGTTVLTGLKFARDRWTGSLYIPDDNIHVSAKLQPLGNRQLKLTGCAFAGLFCRSQIWTRADALPQGG